MDASLYGVANVTPLLNIFKTNLVHLRWLGTVHDGQFNWDGSLLKSNGGAQRYTQRGWKSRFEHKGISVPYCETYKSNSHESGT